MKNCHFVSLVALGFSVLTGEIANGHSSAKVQVARLTVLERFQLPVSEISGMAWRVNPKNGARELLLVSDREYALFLLPWKDGKPVPKVEKIDLRHLRTKKDKKQSQWESVFSDSTGRVIIIKEHPTKVLVLSADLKTLEKTYLLSGRSKASRESGAEGIFPLSNGHLLVVNEKDPLRVIEFGPRGGKSVGYNKNLSLEGRSKGVFLSAIQNADSTDTNLEELQHWDLDESSQLMLEDSSGLNATFDGQLFLLSDQKRSIGLVGDKIETANKKIKLQKYWLLPNEIKQPEGMVFDELNRPIIALDKKKAKKDNLFILSPVFK